jgi:thiol-disulfide isomerase/thioredoxin
MAVGIALAVGPACGPDRLTGDWKRIDPPVPAPEFTLAQLEGEPASLSGFRGRVVIMEFWATWCGPCRYSTPSLEAIYKRHRDRGVAVLLINEGETVERIRRWAGKRFTAPILLDQDGSVSGRYGVGGIPALFVVDQAGRLVYRHGGYGGGLERSLRVILEELLPKHPAADPA